jgi:glutaredoxin 3
MSSITIYTKSWCPYCAAAKKLLTEKGVDFTEIDIEAQPDQRQDMIQKASGRTTVPQIFIGDRHVGGCDDLYALDDKGQLEALLQA